MVLEMPRVGGMTFDAWIGGKGGDLPGGALICVDVLSSGVESVNLFPVVDEAEPNLRVHDAGELLQREMYGLGRVYHDAEADVPVLEIHGVP